VLKRLSDPDWAVRHQLAATLGAFPANTAAADDALMTLFEKYGDDPLTVDAALSGLAGRESAVLEKLVASPGTTPQRTAVVTTLAATIVKSGQDARVQQLLQWIADGSRPAWQQQALIAGAEAALLNAPLPGAPAPRANPAAPAANDGMPGGRGGPGGARAFPDAPADNAGGRRGGAPGAGGGGRGRGAGGPLLALSHQPDAFAALASSGGDVGTRATNLLARMNWPGKPGAPAAAAPLTATQQQSYNTGQTVYTSLCMACHQEDGRGREKVAPSLVGSQLALAAPPVPIRILLHGKEGSVGLMPPLGGGLTDDQIAGALTYVRRQWGNAGSAVDPATVKEVRAATAGRTRPWTNDELLALANGGRGGQPPQR
jgi:mono/diheme cytochrome c family protein